MLGFGFRTFWSQIRYKKSIGFGFAGVFAGSAVVRASSTVVRDEFAEVRHHSAVVRDGFAVVLDRFAVVRDTRRSGVCHSPQSCAPTSQSGVTASLWCVTVLRWCVAGSRWCATRFAVARAHSAVHPDTLALARDAPALVFYTFAPVCVKFALARAKSPLGRGGFALDRIRHPPAWNHATSASGKMALAPTLLS